MDYGAGTGLASLQLLRVWDRSGLTQECADKGVTLELHLVDLANSWFCLAHELLSPRERVFIHAVRVPPGPFVPLPDLFPTQHFDVIVANMVLHLIRPVSLRILADEISQVLKPSGQFYWTAPDIGPARAGSILFHDVNRMVRQLWEAKLDCGLTRGERLRLRGQVTPVTLESRSRAAKRVLPIATELTALRAAMASKLDVRATRSLNKIGAADLRETLLVPANAAELLSECQDVRDSTQFAAALFLEALHRILPEQDVGAPVLIDWAYGSARLGTQ